MADRVLVMYAGRAVEKGTVEDVFYRARMPYTDRAARLDAAHRRRPEERLRPIKGAPPSLINLPPGCPFSPALPAAPTTKCDDAEPRAGADGATGEHLAACHCHRLVDRRWRRGARSDPSPPAGTGSETRGQPVEDARRPTETPVAGRRPSGPRPLLEVRDLVKDFPIKGGGLIRRTVG